MYSENAITLGKLTQKCLKEAYFRPQNPSSYSKGYRFFNDAKYRVYDCPPQRESYNRLLSPIRHLAAAGNELPIIMECRPQDYLSQHWKQWLPAFPPVVFESLDEGLRDNVPIVTTAAIQGIPKNKHSVHPDILYELQLKSSILQMGVPCPKHMDEAWISYPCAVKVDMSSCGRGGWLVKDADELSAVLRQIREVCGWKDPIVFQEFIPGVREVPSFQFYLHKSGELFWIGTSNGGFNGFVWTSGSVDWNKQDEYEKLVYEEFTLPIKNYLQKRGYFGLVTFEILITDHGKYLVDVNPRIGGDTTHLLLARYLALDFGLKHSAIFDQTRHNTTAKMLTEKANNINSTCEGKIVVLSVTDLDDGGESYLSIFTKTPEKVQALFCELNK